MNRKAIILLFLALVLALQVACVIGGESAEEPATNFFEAVADQDYDLAFSMTHSVLQEDVPTAESLAGMFPQVKEWTMESQSVTTDSGDKGSGISGTLTFYNDAESEYELVYLKEDDEYMLAGYNIKDFEDIPQKDGEYYLQNLLDQDFGSANNLHTDSMQSELEESGGLAKVMPEITSYSISGSSNVELDNGDPGVEVDGEVEFYNGTSSEVKLFFSLENGRFKLAGFSFVDLYLSAEPEANAFFTGIQEKDHQSSFDLMTVDLQQEIGDLDAFKQIFPPEIDVTSWDMSSESIFTTTDEKAIRCYGDITLGDGSVSEYELIMILVNNQYQVAGFNFQTK